jgi:hypothetical protein
MTALIVLFVASMRAGTQNALADAGRQAIGEA